MLAIYGAQNEDAALVPALWMQVKADCAGLPQARRIRPPWGVAIAVEARRSLRRTLKECIVAV